MKRTTITICAVLALAACNSDKSQPQVDAKVAAATTATPSEPMPDSATMMKNWMDYMTPGKQHTEMASWNGKWDAEVTMWEKPGAEPTKSTMIAVNEMILGGRYQRSVNKGNMMGMKFEGISTVGFDNAKQVYVSSWIDNMGTGIMNMEGTYDEATKTVSLKGKAVDPMTGKEKEMRETMTLVDNDHQLMQMYCTGPDGKEFKTMQILSTRKK